MDALTPKKKTSRHELNKNIYLIPQHSLRMSPTKTMPSPIPTITLSTPSSTPTVSPATSFTSSFTTTSAVTEGLPERVPPPNISKEIDIPTAFVFFQARLTARNLAKRELARQALDELNSIYVRIAKWYMYRSGPQKYRDEVDARGEEPENPHRFDEFLIVPYTPEPPTWANNLIRQKAIYNTTRLHRDETLKAAFHIRDTTQYEFTSAAERKFTFGICKFWAKRKKLEITQNEFNLEETCLVDKDYKGFDVVRGDKKGEVPYENRDVRQWEVEQVLDNDVVHMERLLRIGGLRSDMRKLIKADDQKWKKKGEREDFKFEEYEVDEEEIERLREGVIEYRGERDMDGRGERFEGFDGWEKVKEVVEEKLEEELVTTIVDKEIEEEEKGGLEGYESEDVLDKEVRGLHDLDED